MGPFTGVGQWEAIDIVMVNELSFMVDLKKEAN